MRAKAELVANYTTDMWNCSEKLKEIRQIVCTTPLTDMEFLCLVELGRATRLNPFQKEIWAVKYKSNEPANIFIGRDGYSTLAKRDREYESHQTEAVYTKDEFRVCNGEIIHNFSPINRGELLGAYCIVKRRSAEKPTYVWVTMEEYNLRRNLWNTKPATMIKKVAEAQALRQAFDGLAGIYSDAEDFTEDMPKLRIVNAPEGNTQTERLKNLLNCNVVDEPVVTYGYPEKSQLHAITELLGYIKLPQERLDKAMANYGVEDMYGLDKEQAEDFLNHLRKLYDKQSNASRQSGEGRH